MVIYRIASQKILVNMKLKRSNQGEYKKMKKAYGFSINLLSSGLGIGSL